MVTPADARLLLALAALVALGLIVGRAAGLGQARALLVAAGRAALQMALLGAVLAYVLRSPRLAPIYLAVALTGATLSCAQRLRPAPHARRVALIAIGAAATTCTAIVFASGALPFDARHGLPFVAQVIGGSMTAAALAGRRLIDDVDSGWAEVEGYLALGASPGRAVREHARRAAARALIPALDQTRNAGVVVLPGAYVGLLLAGASPWEAGRVQLLVLISLLAAETISAVVVTRALAQSLGTRHLGSPKA